MEILIDERTGLEIAYVVNEDGTTFSMLKSIYDEMIAQQEAAQPLL